MTRGLDWKQFSFTVIRRMAPLLLFETGGMRTLQSVVIPIVASSQHIGYACDGVSIAVSSAQINESRRLMFS